MKNDDVVREAFEDWVVGEGVEPEHAQYVFKNNSILYTAWQAAWNYRGK